MKTLDEKPSSKWIIVLGELIIILLGVSSFYFVVKISMQLTFDLYNLPEIIELNKGGFYLWGVGFAMLVMAVGIIYVKYLKKTIPPQMDKNIGKILIVCVVIMFVLPQVVHHATENYLEDYDYVICTSLSTQWLHSRTIVYSRVLPCISKEEYRRRFIE